jgi:diacylglycerol kinase (ATP)
VTVRQATIVVNRQAGSGRRICHVASLVRELVHRGWRVKTVAPRCAADMPGAMATAVEEGADCIVIAGGDGTWHQAVQSHGMLVRLVSHHDGAPPQVRVVPLALLPIGTGDDNARSLGFPVDDPATTADLIDAGRSRTIDLGTVTCGDEKRWFSGVLSVGFDSAVNARANDYHHLPGTLRYVVAAIRELVNFTPGDYTITIDGLDHRFRAMLIAVGNGGHYGGGMAICPDYSHTDGHLDITVIERVPRLRFVTTLPKVYSGQHVRLDQVTTLRAAELEINGDGQLVYADGEPVGVVPALISCVPEVLTIVAA